MKKKSSRQPIAEDQKKLVYVQTRLLNECARSAALYNEVRKLKRQLQQSTMKEQQMKRQMQLLEAEYSKVKSVLDKYSVLSEMER